MLTFTIKNLLKKVFIYVFLFLYIYSPCWIKGIDFITNRYYWGWVSLLFFYDKVFTLYKKKELSQDKIYIRYIFYILCATIFYGIVHFMLAQNVNIKSLRIFQNLYPIVSLLNLTVIVNIMKKLGYDKIDGVCTLLNLAIFQGVICLLMLILPSLKNYANQLFLNSAKFREGDFILLTRVYGITSDYTYGFPIIQGILCGISVYVGLFFKKKYLFLSILIFLSVILNGRTGLLIAICASFYTFLKGVRLKKINFVIVKRLFYISFVVLVLLNALLEHFPIVMRFASGLFTQISEKSGNINYLFNTNLFLPTGLAIIWGEGHSVYGNDAVTYGYKASDIGFVNDLFMGGIVFLLFRYTAAVIIMNYKNNNITDKVISLITLFAWLISCIKGQSTANPMIIACVQYLFVVRYMLEMRDENAV